MKQPPRPRRSRALPPQEPASAPEFAPEDDLRGADEVAEAPQASAEDEPRVASPSIQGEESGSAREARFSAGARAARIRRGSEAGDERAARRERNRELRRLRREAAARPSSGEILRRPIGQSDAATVLGSSEESATADLNERRKERQLAQRRLVITRIATVSAACVVAIALVWGIFFSPLFALDMSKVSIEGLGDDNATISEVQAAVEPFASTPLPRLSTSKVSAAVGGVRLVREAQVERTWRRGLRVTVRPRQAVLAVKEGAAWSLVDDQGVSLSSSPSMPEGMAPTTLPDGDERSRAAGEVAAIWAAMGDELRSQITMITHDGQTVSMTLSNSRTLNWGVASENDLKAKVAQVLISQRQARTYDVSSPVHPVTS